MNHHKIEGEDDTQQTQYITWPGQEVDESQRSILQPVNRNGGRKMKEKVETCHSVKEKSTSLAALKLIAQKRVDEKSQLEKQKTDLLNNLTVEINQIHKAHKDAMEAQPEEMERQRKQFQFEIEMLEERILELEKDKKRPVQGRTQQSNRSMPKYGISTKKSTQAPSEENALLSPTY